MAFDFSNIFGSNPDTGGSTNELGNLQVILGQLSSALDPEMGGHIATGLGKGTLASNARARQGTERKALLSQMLKSLGDPGGKISGMKMDPKTGAMKIDMDPDGEEAPGEGSFGNLETPVQAIPGTSMEQGSSLGDLLNFP